MSSTVEQEQEIKLDETLDELAKKEKVLEDLKAEIKHLRADAEILMRFLGFTDHKHSEFVIFFRSNSARRTMNWKRFEKEFAAIYRQMRKKNIVTFTKPSKLESLVFTKVKANVA